MKLNTIDGLFVCGIAFVVLLTTACNSSKSLQKLVYLQDSTQASHLVVDKIEPVIQMGDRLNITVTALNPASAAPYNLGGGLRGTDVATGTVAGGTTPGYLVKTDGSIQFPQFGTIEVAGKSIKELTDMLTLRLEKYVSEPIVIISFNNYKITMLGEVGSPGPVLIPEGSMNIFEAISIAGDLPLTARRDNILVVRQNGRTREFGRVNLLSKDVFNSPYYYLKQNDMVYVEMTKNKANTNDQTFNNITRIASFASIISSFILLIVNITRN